MPSFMRAAIMTGPHQITVDRVPIPKPGIHQVLVQIEGCGVCASNLPVWQGRPWFRYPLEPGQGGHEAWGRIVAVGEDVHGLAPNDRVTILSSHAYAEYDVADADEIVCLPTRLDDHPFPGEPLGCAMNIFRRSKLEAGQTVAIVGIGFMGALLTRLAFEAGARVLAISRRPFALAMARALGASELIPLDDSEQVAARVRALTNDEGCERVIEAVGIQSTLDLATELTGEESRLIIAGYHQDAPRQVNMQLWNWRGLDVINAHERDPRVYLKGMRAAVDAAMLGSVDASPLYTHTLKLEQLPDAFEMLETRPDGFLKALVTP